MISTDSEHEPIPPELAGWGLANLGEVQAYNDVQKLNDTLSTTGEIVIPKVGDLKPITPGNSQATVKVGETVLGVSTPTTVSGLLRADLLPEERAAVEHAALPDGALTIQSFSDVDGEGYQPDGVFFRVIAPDSVDHDSRAVYPIRGSVEDDHEVVFAVADGRLSLMLDSNEISRTRDGISNPGNRELTDDMTEILHRECRRAVEQFGIEVDVFEVLSDE